MVNPLVLVIYTNCCSYRGSVSGASKDHFDVEEILPQDQVIQLISILVLNNLATGGITESSVGSHLGSFR